MIKNKQKYIITSALPYINGIKHLGTLIGSLLPADIYSRYLRAQGKDVLSVCATDEHGTPAELAALEENLPVEEYCEKYHQIQKKIYREFYLSFDYFGRTSNKSNHKMTQLLFLKLYENGLIEEKETTQLYSIDDQRFLPDRFVRGICPHCGDPNARGDQCENCTKILTPLELIEPRSAISGSKNVQPRKSKQLFINLPKLESEVRQWIETKKEIWPKTSYTIAKSWLDEGLQSRSITRDLKWGIPVPLEEYKDKVFYVWFDAPIGYIGASIDWAEENGKSWEYYWKDPDTTYLQFMGKDNVPFHSVTFPASILGSKENLVLVDVLKGFQWLNFEGGKFSTSQNRGVFTDQALKLYPPDYWRYYLVLIAPERHDTDFQWKGFQSAVNNDLANTLGNFVHRTLTFINRNFNGIVPQQNQLESIDKEIIDLLNITIAELISSLEKVEFQKSLLIIRSFWQECNQYFQSKAPWIDVKENKIRASNTLSISVHLCHAIAILNQIFIPQSSQKIFDYLGLDQQVKNKFWKNVNDFQSLVGNRISKDPKPLFSKIDDKAIERHSVQFRGVEGINQNVTDVKGRPKKKEKTRELPVGIISFQDFQKVKIKVGQIVSGERVLQSKKLLKFEVNLNEKNGHRQIIAGLGEYYNPDDLISKKVLVVTNLELKLIAGQESNGMILAYEDKKDISSKPIFKIIELVNSAIIGSEIS